MVMYANDVETKEKEKLPEIKKLTTTVLFFPGWICPFKRPFIPDSNPFRLKKSTS